MKISVKGIDCNNIQERLNTINSKNAIPNLFIYTKKKDSKVSFYAKENDEFLFEIDSIAFGKWIDLASSYVGLLNPDEEIFEFSVFADLHTHTEFSILDGANKISKLAKKYPYSGAITDHGVVYGWIEFFQQMDKLHKHPIFGCEVYTRSRTDEPNKYHLLLLAKNKKGIDNLTKISSIAQEHENYGGNFPQKPLVSYDNLRNHSEGIICLSACLGGEIPSLLREENYIEAEQVVKEMIDIFGKENFYLEIQRHASNLPKETAKLYQKKIKERTKLSFDVAKACAKSDKDSFIEKFGKYLYQDMFASEEEEHVNKQLERLAKKFDLKLVATTDSHYLNIEDAKTHEALLCNQTGKTMEDVNRWTFTGVGYHVHSSEEMEELFRDIPEALVSSLEIAEKCNFQFEFGHYNLPKFDVPSPYTTESYLRKLCEEGYHERYAGTEFDNAETKERLEFELNTIIKMGYPSYFLIVWDFLRFARENGIAIGPGRGSAAGSIVSYCLHITNLDPLPYGLLFERFLNPDRISMPDIDIDIQHDRREEVIEYCRKKYGTNAVSRIITFGTMAARKVIEDMCRIYNKKGKFEKYNQFSEYIKKMIPLETNITLEKALKESPELVDAYATDKDVKFILDESLKLEGLKRNISTHACGIVISDGDVNNYCPTVSVYDKDTKNWCRTAAFNMNEIEQIGCLKMDFLGLKTMTVLDDCARHISNYEMTEMTIDDMPLNDVETYQHIAMGETEGMFQLESPGMTSFMKQLFQDVNEKVTKIKRNVTLSTKEKQERLDNFGNELFERLIAGISLYRPGPMDFIPQYIEGMISGKIVYDHPMLEEILAPTYGVFVYQEQVIQAVQKLAGFSKGQADYIRKAMGKKKTAIIDEYADYFVYGSGTKLDDHTKQPLDIKGCVNNGVPKETAIIIYDKMREFGKYAFNKSHAASYAVNSARTGWCAVHYPVIFYKAMLNSFIENADKVKFYLQTIRQRHITMLPPSINHSRMKFLIENDDKIRFGLRGLKYVGNLSDQIIEERNERGNFSSYRNFLERMIKYRKIDTRSVESLVFTGAFDEFEGTRKAKLEILDELLIQIKSGREFEVKGQLTIFDCMPELNTLKEIPIPDIEEFDKKFLLFKEEHYAGFFILGHPLDEYISLIKENKEIQSLEVFTEQDDSEMEKNRIEELSNNKTKVFVTGILNNLDFKITAKGERMATFVLQDQSSEIRCVCFPKMLQAQNFEFMEHDLVTLRGTFSKNNFGSQIIVESVGFLENLANEIKEIQLTAVEDETWAKNQWKDLRELLTKIPGTSTNVTFIWKGKETNLGKVIDMNYLNFVSCMKIFGEQNIKISI